jgi:hypothetical protein
VSSSIGVLTGYGNRRADREQRPAIIGEWLQIEAWPDARLVTVHPLRRRGLPLSLIYLNRRGRFLLRRDGCRYKFRQFLARRDGCRRKFRRSRPWQWW